MYGKRPLKVVLAPCSVWDFCSSILTCVLWKGSLSCVRTRLCLLNWLHNLMPHNHPEPIFSGPWKPSSLAFKLIKSVRGINGPKPLQHAVEKTCVCGLETQKQSIKRGSSPATQPSSGLSEDVGKKGPWPYASSTFLQIALRPPGRIRPDRGASRP